MLKNKKSYTNENQIPEMNTNPEKWSLDFMRCIWNEPNDKWYSYSRSSASR